MKVLIDGVAMGEQVFRFIGHSNSQMKSKTCWLHQGTLEENEDILDRVGYFKSIKSASKRAKRVGLLFTNISSWISVSEKFKEEEDEDIEMNLGCHCCWCGQDTEIPLFCDSTPAGTFTPQRNCWWVPSQGCL